MGDEILETFHMGDVITAFTNSAEVGDCVGLAVGRGVGLGVGRGVGRGLLHLVRFMWAKLAESQIGA